MKKLTYRYRYTGDWPASTTQPDLDWQPGEEKLVEHEINNPWFLLVEEPAKDEPGQEDQQVKE